MYVMLVDDEEIILNGIVRFLLRKWPDMEISRFDNGEDALTTMAKRIPDLLITDISMPEMDGMEVIEAAAKLGVEHYAVLTGYDDFTLVQRALRLKTMDYLLKPVDKNQLYGVVEQAMEISKMESEKAEKILLSNLRLMCQFGVSADHLLYAPGEAEVFAGGERFGLFLSNDNSEESFEVRSALEKVRALTLQILPLGLDQSGHNMYLLPFEARHEEKIAAWGSDIGHKAFFHGFAIGQAHLTQLHKVYCTALEGSGARLHQAVTAFAGREEKREEAVEALDALFMCLEGFSQRMDAMDRFLGMVNCRQSIWTLAALLSGYPQQSKEDRLRLLQAWLEGLDHIPIPTSREIVQAIDIIGQRYNEDMNLMDISKQVFMTPSYFSTLFHKETGQTYVDYMNQVRISKACRFILQNEMTIESIAAQVGFANTHYFFKVFKRYTGMTPGAFRQLAR